MLTKEQIQQTVAAYFRDKPVKRVYLFGSYARGEATEDSDVDLLIYFDEGVRTNYFTLGGYLADMQDSLNKRVDLVINDLVYPQIKSKIEADKLLMFQRA